jgi:hypothetical protein
VKLTTHLQLVPKSRKCGSIHPLLLRKYAHSVTILRRSLIFLVKYIGNLKAYSKCVHNLSEINVSFSYKTLFAPIIIMFEMHIKMHVVLHVKSSYYLM